MDLSSPDERTRFNYFVSVSSSTNVLMCFFLSLNVLCKSFIVYGRHFIFLLLVTSRYKFLSKLFISLFNLACQFDRGDKLGDICFLFPLDRFDILEDNTFCEFSPFWIGDRLGDMFRLAFGDWNFLWRGELWTCDISGCLSNAFNSKRGVRRVFYEFSFTTFLYVSISSCSSLVCFSKLKSKNL